MRLAVTTSLNIRRMQADDLRFVRQLAISAFGEYDPGAAATVSRLARTGTAWVAYRGPTPVGFAVAHSAGHKTGELSAIAVDELARGSGVGRALLRHVENALRAEGVEELSLHTAQANVAALEMFSKQGYRLQRRLPRFYRGVFDACAFSKRLAFEQK